MKTLFPILALAVLFTGCTAVQLQDAEAKATAAAQTGLNVLETVNVATGGVLTTAAANYALKITHNTGDESIVDATIAEATAAEKVQLAAKASGVTDPVALQAVTTGALTSPAVLAAGIQAVSPSVSAVPATPAKS